MRAWSGPGDRHLHERLEFLELHAWLLGVCPSGGPALLGGLARSKQTTHHQTNMQHAYVPSTTGAVGKEGRWRVHAIAGGFRSPGRSSQRERPGRGCPGMTYGADAPDSEDSLWPFSQGKQQSCTFAYFTDCYHGIYNSPELLLRPRAGRKGACHRRGPLAGAGPITSRAAGCHLRGGCPSSWSLCDIGTHGGALAV